MGFLNFTAKLLECTALIAVGVWKGFLRMASPPKIYSAVKKIGTHDGVFHCDEALACFMLRQISQFKNAKIIRTRDPSILNTCDAVVDVGGVYDSKIFRYDHHQRDFFHSLADIRPDLAKNKHIKLSSAGLVYAHHGMEILNEILLQNNFTATSDCLKGLYTPIYDGFIEELDAIDNGIPMYTEGRPKYRINTHLSARIHRLNPEWNSPEMTSTDGLFEKAMDLAGSEFVDKVVEMAKVWWPAREIVRKSLFTRMSVHNSGEIVELKDRCPWKDHLLSLEEELKIVGKIKFVIYHDKTNTWRVQGVPVQPDSFICRIFLHKDWQGVRDQQLSEIARIDGCIFCHSTGFIGGNQTKEGALQMAIQSLEAASVNVL